MPTTTRDPTMALALQEYLTLHKRRSSYSSPISPISPTSTPATNFPFPSRASRHMSTDSIMSNSSAESSPSPLEASSSRRSISSTGDVERELLRASTLQEIDQGILALLEELLKSKTATSDRKFRDWVQIRLAQKERDLRDGRGD